MESLLKTVLENNPDLYIHASKIDAGLIQDKTGKEIVVRLDTSKIPEGFKLSKGGHWYYVKTKVLAHNIYKMSSQYLTEFGWKSEENEPLSELVEKTPITVE